MNYFVVSNCLKMHLLSFICYSKIKEHQFKCGALLSVWNWLAPFFSSEQRGQLITLVGECYVTQHIIQRWKRRHHRFTGFQLKPLPHQVWSPGRLFFCGSVLWNVWQMCCQRVCLLESLSTSCHILYRNSVWFRCEQWGGRVRTLTALEVCCSAAAVSSGRCLGYELLHNFVMFLLLYLRIHCSILWAESWPLQVLEWKLFSSTNFTEQL